VEKKEVTTKNAKVSQMSKDIVLKYGWYDSA